MLLCSPPSLARISRERASSAQSAELPAGRGARRRGLAQTNRLQRGRTPHPEQFPASTQSPGPCSPSTGPRWPSASCQVALCPVLGNTGLHWEHSPAGLGGRTGGKRHRTDVRPVVPLCSRTNISRESGDAQTGKTVHRSPRVNPCRRIIETGGSQTLSASVPLRRYVFS